VKGSFACISGPRIIATAGLRPAAADPERSVFSAPPISACDRTSPALRLCVSACDRTSRRSLLPPTRRRS